MSVSWRPALSLTWIVGVGLRHVVTFLITGVKPFPFHTVKAYRGSGYVAPVILNLGISCRWVVNFSPHQFTSGGEPRFLLTRSVCRPQSRYVYFREIKQFLLRTDNRIPDQICSTPNIIQRFGREAWGKETTLRPGRRWEANVKMGLERNEVGQHGLCHPAQDRCKWRLPEIVGNFLTC
jgi:hypothetical protein